MKINPHSHKVYDERNGQETIVVSRMRKVKREEEEGDKFVRISSELTL